MRTLPARIQARLSRTYGLDGAPPVDDFIQPTDGEHREALLLHDPGDGEGIELALHLPRRVLHAREAMSFDDVCQVVEGVSHFLYVVERARREMPMTQLELELQAEVDKYVLLLHGGEVGSRRFEPVRSPRILARLFERVTFAHPAGTEPGDRYRMANQLAARFAGRLEERFARRGRFEQMRSLLCRFYNAGQAEKIELARAA
jgi:hypothetical protein